MTSTFVSTAAVLFGTIWNVKAHSWVECTQYETSISGQDYDSSQCVGYPRSWADYGSSLFGEDRGANYQPGGEGATAWCSKTIGDPSSDYSGTYSDAYPYAEYTAGSTVRVVWPAKNHANYECFGNIPDFAMKILVNPNVDPSSDLTALDDWVTLIDWHEEAGKSGTTAVDGVPFTNCPSFCDDTDKAVCYGDMEITESVFSQGAGYYTFMWYWAFNGDDDIYTMCWEAYVDTDGTVTNIEDGDSSEDSSGSGGSSAQEYLVQVPICYKGAEYNEDTVLQGATNLFGNLQWAVTTLEDGAGEFNATLQTQTSNEPKNITEAADNDDHLFCQEIMTLFGDDGSHECYSCYDVEVYTDGSNSSSGGDSGSAITAVVIVLVIVVLIIGAGIAYQKLQDKKTPQSTQPAGAGMTGQTNTSQAISPVQETR